ncbi:MULTISPECIES: glycerol-3-phosphate dehydrogenase/oxidase [unclassified Streptomyces]|uniref:glycerol-3-phosphate dehydrogenase/oxidase n=1 Tax=unclassified Streptomyces TaxID=2593676 RepID=UPI002237242E|nr:glycerol-3-phosphate dehydrogenase/oxidase [Streptomyces sp. SHP 1-2]MCW5254774.1 glycerol-3-phosphate dehydrogenase/oxidase [Streptomyces sp. SHP 1-2]
MTGTALNAARRERELAEAVDGRTVDLLVVGLGATGAGVTLDAAARGLSVVAIDAHDLAFGTSRWSSKLIHGGLRYIAKGQISVAHESAIERGILMCNTAPHLVRPLPMLSPLDKKTPRAMALMGFAGLLVGDVLRRLARTPSSVLHSPRWISAAKTARLAPGLKNENLRGGQVFVDGQLEDDARLVVALARTAAGRGARVLTHTRALDVRGDGATVVDELTGTEHRIKARAVINAGGVWAAQLVPGITVQPSRGTHLVFRAEALGNITSGVNILVPGTLNRYVFALPQPDGLVYLGLTDDPIEGPVPDVPTATEEDIDFLLRTANSTFRRTLTREDVVGVYSGLRPLLGQGSNTADISRKHAVLTSPEGVITIVGGKLTTYRRMAEDAVDAAVAQRGLPAAPCSTRNLPLVGAADRKVLKGLPGPSRLVRKYGTEAELVASGGAPEPLGATVPVTEAEIAFAVTHEGAMTMEDVLERRTRISMVPADRDAVRGTAQRIFESSMARVRRREEDSAA